MPDPNIDTSKEGALVLNTETLRASTAHANDYSVAQYKTEWGTWSRNIALRVATGQPAEPEPLPPSIKLLDESKFRAILTAYIDLVLSGGTGEFDPSGAFTSVAYPALTLPAAPPEPGQPDNPVGAPMGGGYYGVAPGDKHVDGYTTPPNPFGVRYRKYIVVNLANTPAEWYQVVTS